ncbi:MAG TPA: FAD-dependent oxidoreductase [Candidatus Bathyarchaeia archaeon]|nr:FAD-dependent oxidoreductase [Candidatus Bathyarchaeia archaeon]
MRIVVVGSGAGGATAARELSGKGFEVLVLEAGKQFRPFTRQVGWVEPLRRFGILGDERNIGRLFSHMKSNRPSRDLMLIRGITSGGGTGISCGNMARAERGLDEIDLDLSPEFHELETSLGVTTIPRDKWRPTTRRMFEEAARLNLDPIAMPKAVNVKRCVSCGLCALGCAKGAKWDAQRFISDLETKGGILLTESPVRRLILDGGRVTGVEVACGINNLCIPADVVVLAAGGIGTAGILGASGLTASDTLWAGVTVTLGGVKEGSHQEKEQPQVWYAKQENYVLSPNLDMLSNLFYAPWRSVSINARVGLAIRVADASDGSVAENGTVHKILTHGDLEKLKEGVESAKRIMASAGVRGPFIRGLASGDQSGGTVPLTKADVPQMRPNWLPEGLWVADLSLVPTSQDVSADLTAAALGLRVARCIIEEFSAL